MTNLRIFGLLVGVLGLLFTFFKYRGPNWKRSNFVLSALFNLCIITISVNPNSVNFARDVLLMEEYQYGRLIALLIISNVILFFLTFMMRSKQGVILTQVDKLVRGLGAIDLKEKTDNSRKFKPVMVVIPAYNEAENLQVLLPRMPLKIDGIDIGVLVVDDGSDDDTVRVTIDQGYLAVSNIINRGGGAALRLGYDILKKAGAKICVTMDADGQHQPEEIEKLVSPILNEKT